MNDNDGVRKHRGERAGALEFALATESVTPPTLQKGLGDNRGGVTPPVKKTGQQRGL